MCGIWGFFGTPRNKSEIVRFMWNLAVATEERGVHSCGFFAMDDEYSYVEKGPMKASTFLKQSKYFKRSILNGSKIMVGHNRQASVGIISTENAHPFETDELIVVHNGTCRKMKDLLPHYGLVEQMEGDTDSEALALLLDDEGINNAKGFVKKFLTNYSVVVFNREDNKLHLFRDPERPMYIADMRSTHGVRVFVSTEEIFMEALEKSNINRRYKGFQTKSLHWYTVSPFKSLEVTNEGRYAPAPPPKQRKGTISYGNTSYPAYNPSYQNMMGIDSYLDDEGYSDDPEVPEREVYTMSRPPLVYDNVKHHRESDIYYQGNQVIVVPRGANRLQSINRARGRKQ